MNKLVPLDPTATEIPDWPSPDMRIAHDDRAPAPMLEDDALPAGWEQWIEDEASSRACPRDYVAASLLAAASALIGNARHVAANSTWTECPHIWLALVGEPSTGKTPAERPIIEACRAIERDAEPGWQAAMADNAVLVESARAIEEQWRAAVRDATKQAQSAPERPSGADQPAEPPRPRVLVMDATTEELQRLLAGQPRGLLHLRDELSGWFGNLDRYGGQGGDRAFFLETWNGGVYVADRVKNRGQPLRIPRAALAMLGGMQPDRLREVLAGADDGLAERFAYVWPDPLPVLPLQSGGDGAARDRRERLARAMRRLYALPMDGDPGEDPAPCLTPLANDAFRLFDELRQDAMHRSRSVRGVAAGWHGKTPGRALRFALIYELLTWAAGVEPSDPRVVGADAMARAGGYIDYLAAMFDRVTAGLAIRPAEADAAAIARHILSTAPALLNERSLYQLPGFSWLRDYKRRAAALRVLAESGWIRPASRSGSGRPRGDWSVSPRLSDSST